MTFVRYIVGFGLLLTATGVQEFALAQPGESSGGQVLLPMPLIDDSDIERNKEIAPNVRATYARGRELFDQGELTAALSQFNAAVQADPAFAEGHLARGRVLALMQQPRSAIRALGDAINQAADDRLRATIYLERGQAYLDDAEPLKALDDFQQAAEIAPADADIAYQRGRALRAAAEEDVAAGDPEAVTRLRRAVAAFDQAIELQPGLAEAWADRAAARADLGDVDTAIDDMKQAVAIDADNPMPAYRLAVLHLQRAGSASTAGGASATQRRVDLQSAIAMLTTALDLSERDMLSRSEETPSEFDPLQAQLTRAVARLELASLLPAAERTGAYQAALQDCDAVLAKNAGAAGAHFQRGVALRLLGDYRQAVAAFSEAIRLSPDSLEARIRRGIAWYYQGEYDLAAKDFHAVGVVPGDPRPMFWTGVVHAQRGEHLEAVRDYSESIDENPRYRPAYVNRALSLMHLGQWQRAIDDWNELIQLQPDDADAYYRRGIAQQQMGNRAAARRSFELANALRRRD